MLKIISEAENSELHNKFLAISVINNIRVKIYSNMITENMFIHEYGGIITHSNPQIFILLGERGVLLCT